MRYDLTDAKLGDRVRWRAAPDSSWQEGHVYQVGKRFDGSTYVKVRRPGAVAVLHPWDAKPSGAHADRSRPVDAQPPNDAREPRWPEGTRRYASYQRRLTVELDKWAHGEAPYQPREEA